MDIWDTNIMNVKLTGYLLIVLLLPVIIYYAFFNKKHYSDEDLLKTNIEPVKISKLTNFQWDKVIIYESYNDLFHRMEFYKNNEVVYSYELSLDEEGESILPRIEFDIEHNYICTYKSGMLKFIKRYEKSTGAYIYYYRPLNCSQKN